MSELLSIARRRLGWSRHRLACRAGLDKNAVYDIESGKNGKPSHFAVTRIVAALRAAGIDDVTAESLFPVPPVSANAAGVAGERAMGAAE